MVESASDVQDEDEIAFLDIFHPNTLDRTNLPNGQWKHLFHLADVEAFMEPVVVLPDIGNEDVGRYFVMKPRQL